MQLKKTCAVTIAVIALNGCANVLSGSSEHLLSNGNQDTVIDDTQPPKTSLVGLSNSTVVERMGQPDLQRFEDGVAYWRYSTRHCLVDMYLSDGESDGDLQVDYMTVRAKSLATPSGACPLPATDKRNPARDVEFRLP